FLLTLIVLAYLLHLGGRLRTRIFDEMRAIWRRPVQSAHSPSQSMVYHIRTTPAYVWLWKTGKGIVLPTIAGVVAAIVVAGLASKGGFELSSAACLRRHPTPLRMRAAD